MDQYAKVNKWDHINTMKDKNHISISINAEKNNKIPHPFIIKKKLATN